MSTDPFASTNNKARTKAIVDERKAAGDEATKAAKQRMAARAKPKFNDLPRYQPKWNA